jgi:hypothetical protein
MVIYYRFIFQGTHFHCFFLYFNQVENRKKFCVYHTIGKKKLYNISALKIFERIMILFELNYNHVKNLIFFF